MKLRWMGILGCALVWMIAASVSGGRAVAVAAAAAPDDAAKFEGRPDFTPGSDRGYFVWREGNKWHVRWTTQGGTLRFTGNVQAVGGKLKGLKRIDVEKETAVIRRGAPPRVWVGPRGRTHVRGGAPPVVATTVEDKIEKEGDQKIYWISKNEADLDGFDFEVAEGVEVLKFEMLIGGKTNAMFVRAGKDRSTVSGNPFRVDVK